MTIGRVVRREKGREAERDPKDSRKRESQTRSDGHYGPKHNCEMRSETTAGFQARMAGAEL